MAMLDKLMTMGLILLLSLKMAKKKANIFISMKMGIKIKNFSLKMTKQMANKLNSMKVDPKKLNFTVKMAKEKAKKLVSI